MWNAVWAVSNIFTLIAFVAACVVVVQRRRLLQRQKLIQAAPEAERAGLIEAMLDRFSVSTEGLTRQQRYDLALELIYQRAERFRLGIIIGALVFVISAVLAVVAWTYTLPTPEPPAVYVVRVLAVDPQGQPVDGTEVVSSLGGEKQEVSGGWEINIPAANRPADGRLEVHVTKDSAFLSGSASVTLGEERSVSVPLTTQEVDVRGVVESPDGTGLGGVRVSVAGYGDEGVLTENDGSFQLPAHAADGQSVLLRAQKDGFDPVQEWVIAGRHPVSLRLSARAAGL